MANGEATEALHLRYTKREPGIEDRKAATAAISSDVVQASDSTIGTSS